MTQLVPFVHCPQNQAFVQYSSIEDAKNAKEKIQHSNLQSDGEVFYFEAQFSNYKQLDIRDHSNSYSETHQRRETTASSEVSQPITICSETPSDPTQRLVNNFGPLQPGSRDTGFPPASAAAVSQATNYYNRSSSSSSSHSSASFLKSPNQMFQHPNYPFLPYTNRDYQTLNQVVSLILSLLYSRTLTAPATLRSTPTAPILKVFPTKLLQRSLTTFSRLIARTALTVLYRLTHARWMTSTCLARLTSHTSPSLPSPPAPKR